MNTKPFLIALVLSFSLMILGSITGSVLQSRSKITIEKLGPAWTLALKLFYMLLFGVMGFSLVPVALHFFLSMQIGAGNGDFVLIRWLAANEPRVVYGIWGLFAAGLAISLPAMIRSGLFK